MEKNIKEKQCERQEKGASPAAEARGRGLGMSARRQERGDKHGSAKDRRQRLLWTQRGSDGSLRLNLDRDGGGGREWGEGAAATTARRTTGGWQKSGGGEDGRRGIA
ncbi:hypothetical protein PIB30_077497 [Stylosanthes scabra]|uniref:Uncharacterized protein n=1 Tax=Stylosanthes scabra TaxID=79078 RepID=A0ABU6ZP96_9FABA|nr:hypothetical protein [Stylosanthes scabra]